MEQLKDSMEKCTTHVLLMFVWQLLAASGLDIDIALTGLVNLAFSVWLRSPCAGENDALNTWIITKPVNPTTFSILDTDYLVFYSSTYPKKCSGRRPISFSNLGRMSSLFRPFLSLSLSFVPCALSNLVCCGGGLGIIGYFIFYRWTLRTRNHLCSMRFYSTCNGLRVYETSRSMGSKGIFHSIRIRVGLTTLMSQVRSFGLVSRGPGRSPFL